MTQDVNWGAIDYLVVDAPPGTSDEHISIAQYLKATQVDGAVIVTTPQEVSLIDVRKEINFCKKVSLPGFYSCLLLGRPQLGVSISPMIPSIQQA